METIRHMALGCCVLSTVAGVLRIFWPRNGFGAVINAVLALYIISAGFQMLGGADWRDLSLQCYDLAKVAQRNPVDYTDYSQQLGLSASVQAVQTVLAEAGVAAVVTWNGESCLVELAREADRTRAEAVLAASCGTLPVEILAGGETQ